MEKTLAFPVEEEDFAAEVDSVPPTTKTEIPEAALAVVVAVSPVEDSTAELVSLSF